MELKTPMGFKGSFFIFVNVILWDPSTTFLHCIPSPFQNGYVRKRGAIRSV
jgi:hypothetical protein